MREHVPLREYTTFRIGGTARYLFETGSLPALREALAFAREKNLPVLILGGGSNVLLDDAPCEGVVIRMVSRGIVFEEEGSRVRVTAEAGESWDALVAETVSRGLWGLENLSGIPGTVGGAPIQNIGAYGVELTDTLTCVEVFDRHDSSVHSLTNAQCAFAYRSSRFKTTDPDRFVVLSATFALSKGALPKLHYKDLEDTFARGSTPTVQDIRAAVLAIRARKFPDLSVVGCAGSFFKNPVVSKEKAAELAKVFSGLPQFETKEGVKLSLAWLFDKALGLRGFREGLVHAYENQPLVIVADSGARAQDVRTFARAIQKSVREKFGIEIEPEVCVVRACAITHAL